MEELLQVNFQVLVHFVQDEAVGISRIDWSATEEHAKAYVDMMDLYDWWTIGRPNRVDPVESPDLVNPPMEFKELPDGLLEWLPYDAEKYPEYDLALKESMRLDQAWWEEDQRNLHRLIDIRSFLWT